MYQLRPIVRYPLWSAVIGIFIVVMALPAVLVHSHENPTTYSEVEVGAGFYDLPAIPIVKPDGKPLRCEDGPMDIGKSWLCENTFLTGYIVEEIEDNDAAKELAIRRLTRGLRDEAAAASNGPDVPVGGVYTQQGPALILDNEDNEELTAMIPYTHINPDVLTPEQKEEIDKPDSDLAKAWIVAYVQGDAPYRELVAQTFAGAGILPDDADLPAIPDTEVKA